MKTKLFLVLIILAFGPWLGADVFYIYGNIASNATWEYGDVYVLNGEVKVLNGVNLTIASGVDVHFEVDSSLVVEGSIDVLGNASAPVIFKPQAIEMFSDRRYTNILLNGAESSSFSYCHFSYANHPEGIVRIVNSHSSISFDHCSFNVNDSGNGIFLYNDSSSYDTTLNLNNVQISAVNPNGVYIHGNRNLCTFDGLSVNGCNSGISVYEWHNPVISIADLSVANSRSYITVMRLSHYHNLPHVNVSNPALPYFYANGYNTLYSDLTLSNQSHPYLAKYSISMQSGTNLTLQSGCELAFEQYGKIEMRGGSSLTALGTASLPIVLSSKDSNTTWGGLYFEQNTSANLDNCTFLRSGYSNEYGHWIPTIQADRNTNISISNSTINASNSYAIECFGSGNASLMLNNVSLRGAAVAGFHTANSDLNFSYQNLSIQNCGVPLRIPANLIASLNNQPTLQNNTNNWITILNNGNIYRDTIFRNFGIPFRSEVALMANYVSITIDPGVTIQFGNELTFSIRGSLHVNGIAENPVSFTRLAESTSYWMGFYLDDACTLAEFNWANFTWAASPQYGNRNAIHIYRADNVSIQNCTMNNLNGTGIFSEGVSSTDSLVINNLSISNAAGDGIYLSSGYQNVTIDGFTASNCAWYPISISQKWIHQVQNIDLQNNANQLIQLLYGSQISGLPNLGYPYLISSPLTVNYGMNVSFDPGTTLWFGDDQYINVYGNLIANGSAEAPITFSRRNGTNHYWQGISLYNNSTAEFSHCVFSYGGKEYPYGDRGLIQNSGASMLTISNCRISNIQEQAIRILDAQGSDSVSIQNLLIENGATDGVYIDSENPTINIVGLTIQNCARNPLSLPMRYIQNLSELILDDDSVIRIIRSGQLGQHTLVPYHGYPLQVEVDISLNAGYQLTIMPGNVFRMVGERCWNIYGSFSANGTADSLIVFTRQINTTSYWQGLRFYSSCPMASMAFCHILYAGYNQYDHSRYAILNDSAASVTIQHCLIDESYGHGIKVTQPSPTDVFTIENCIISNVGMNGFNSDTESYNLNADNLSFVNGVGYPIYARADLMDRFHGVSATGFGNPFFAFWGYQVNHSAVWQNMGLPYLALSNLDVIDGVTLTLEAGVHLKFADYVQYQNNPALKVYGTLHCNGSLEAPITISGMNPGGGSSWNGITFYYPDSPCNLRYTYIKNAGVDEQHSPSDEFCSLYVIGGTVNLANCFIQNATHHLLKTDTGSTVNATSSSFSNAGARGIWMMNGTLNMSSCTITACTEAGIYYQNGSLSFANGNKIHANGENIHNHSQMPLSASHIWWGSLNPIQIDTLLWDDEEGNGRVDFEPWYDETLSQLYYHILPTPNGLCLEILNDTTLQIAWEGVAGANYYQIWVAENPTDEDWDLLADNVEANSYQISMESFAKRFFRIVAKG